MPGRPTRSEQSAPTQVAAVGLRDKSVERRAHTGEALRTVDAQLARRLIKLVFDGIRRHDLDKSVERFGRIGPG